MKEPNKSAGAKRGKRRQTWTNEAAYFAAYRKLRTAGKSHRQAIEQLGTADFPFKEFEYRPFQQVPHLNESRIKQIVALKNKVIADLRRQGEEKKAALRSLRGGLPLTNGHLSTIEEDA